jgi:hypothetical protein
MTVTLVLVLMAISVCLARRDGPVQADRFREHPGRPAARPARLLSCGVAWRERRWPRPERKRLRESPRGCDPWPPRPRRNFAGYSKWHGRSARQWSPERTPRLYAHARHQRTVLRIWEGPALRHRRDARPRDRLSNGAKGTDDPARTSPAPSGAGRAGHQQAGGPTAARGEPTAQTVKRLSLPIKRTIAARL